MGKCVHDTVFLKIWTFDSYEEILEAAKKECCVCGDNLREYEEDNLVHIYNLHQSSTRWEGRLIGTWTI